MKLVAGIAIDPAEVRAALRTRCYLPRPAGKPRERTLGAPEMDTSRCGGKTPDVVHEATWIDERVLVRAAHLHALVFVGDLEAAGRADQWTLARRYPVF